MRIRRVAAPLLAVSVLAVGLSTPHDRAVAVPNPVATDEVTYQAFGRVFPDPHGCLAYGVPDLDGDGVKDTPRGISPWAKGRVCADQFLTYEEVVEGTKFLSRRFPELLRVIRLDQAYDNGNFMSAGIPRMVANEDGTFKLMGRDRRPLYMFKATDSTSPIPEREREHFVYALSIHGIERAGVEGGVRAMEDLVTWAACEKSQYSQGLLASPVCQVEGPFPKRIVETPTTQPVPTAGDVLRGSVIYFVLANPDGWARGQVAPVEVEDGSPNANYVPGFFYQRYNGNGVDLNRDWPTKGYTFKPYSPGSEPETKAFSYALRGIKRNTAAGKFSGGIDLHGMITAYAFSYTLLGSGQRDFRKNEITVDTSVRTWEDQTQRLRWSPWVADESGDGQPDGPCVTEPVLGGGTRGRVPACVADEWGTVIDTIGYQITGGLGDWIESPLGLDAVGIDNEMFASHLAPNTLYEPALTQTHIDGNKGLIYSQIASMLTVEDIGYEPAGRIAYVHNPKRLVVEEGTRIQNPGLPAQNDIEVLFPCQDVVLQNIEASFPCEDGTMTLSPLAFEFDVRGPKEGIWNGGITVTTTKPNATGISDGNIAGIQLQYFDEGQWHTAASDFNQSFLYLQAGAIITVNDPQPGRWRVVFNPTSAFPLRLKIDFNRFEAEEDPGQAAIDASSMEFFEELNRYVPAGRELEAVAIEDILADPASLDGYDSVVVVNDVGDRGFLGAATGLGLSQAQADAYFAALRGYAERGGNLVLTDAALKATAEVGLLAAGDVQRSTALVGNYQFQIATGNVTYRDPNRYPLAAGVAKPGAAEQQVGRRQAVEPTPLGYTPDTGYDGTPQMPFWHVARAAWQAACGLPDCVTAATTQNGNRANLGEARLGQGRVRMAGILFPNPVFQPDHINDHRFGVASYALTYTAWEVFQNLVRYQRPDPPSLPDLTVTDITTASKVLDGRTARITARVTNGGNAGAGPSTAAFLLDGATPIGEAVTPAVPAGGSVEVAVDWITGGVKGERTIRVVADAAGQVTESDEGNNAATLSVTVKGNKVTNGSFEQESASGGEPEGWTGSSTGAGQASWSDDGEGGSKAVAITGTGGSVLGHGAPTWASAPFDVSPGEVLDVVASVRTSGASSAPRVGLALLGPTGNLLDTIGVLTAPLSTNGFRTLEGTVTIPTGVARVRLVLTGFAPTDLKTSGTVTFDDVGVYAR